MAFIEIINLDLGLHNDVFVTNGMIVKKLITGDNVIINLTNSNDDGAINCINISVSGLTSLTQANKTTKQINQEMLFNNSDVLSLMSTCIAFYKILGFEKNKSVLMATDTLSFIFNNAKKTLEKHISADKQKEIKNKIKHFNRCLDNNNLNK